MNLKNKRIELIGLAGGLGVVVALAGFVGGMMSIPTTIVATFAVWIIGPLLVQVLTDPPEKR
ncbi:MAG: hypothetical protein KDK26_18640 [Roseivivax sp.]|nr:hypothetical protein [Roseivivax sp.]